MAIFMSVKYDRLDVSAKYGHPDVSVKYGHPDVTVGYGRPDDCKIWPSCGLSIIWSY